MSVEELATRLVERLNRLRRAAGSGDGDEGIAELLREQDRALTAPGAGKRAAALADRLDGPALRPDAPQLPFRVEGDLPAVRRPERAARVFGARQPSHLEAVERAHPDRISSSLVLELEQDAPCVRRQRGRSEEDLA